MHVHVCACVHAYVECVECVCTCLCLRMTATSSILECKCTEEWAGEGADRFKGLLIPRSWSKTQRTRFQPTIEQLAASLPEREDRLGHAYVNLRGRKSMTNTQVGELVRCSAASLVAGIKAKISTTDHGHTPKRQKLDTNKQASTGCEGGNGDNNGACEGSGEKTSKTVTAEQGGHGDEGCDGGKDGDDGGDAGSDGGKDGGDGDDDLKALVGLIEADARDIACVLDRIHDLTGMCVSVCVHL